jgi:transposase
VDKHLFKQSEPEGQAFKKLCRTPFACEADAQQALATFEGGLQATFLSQKTIHATPHYSKRGRPSQEGQPAQVLYYSEGGLASRLAAHQALVDQHRCFLRATNELDATKLPPQVLLEGYKGQVQAERGCRVLKDPQLLASSFYRKKPERIMALLMIMTVCLLVYAALEYRIRKALQEHDATFPNQKGQPVQNPTARWVFHYFVGIHLLHLPDPRQWPLVLNLTAEHQRLLQLLGDRYAWFYR